MFKKMPRMLCALLTLAMLLALAPASLGEAEGNALPLSTTGETLTIYCAIDGQQSAAMKDLSEHSVVKQIEEETGVTLKFVHPPLNDDGTFFNTTIASGEWPDLFYTDRFNYYPGGIEGAMEDRILMDIDDLVEQYAPNFNALIATQGDNIQKMIRGDGGHITKYGTMFLPPFVDRRVHNGLVVRKDWLEKYGLEAPVTLDEYTDVLRVFKENGVEVPLALPKFTDTQFNNTSPIATAFGVCYNDFVLDADGKVLYSRTMDEYKDFLTFMNGWAQEGLIDRDLVSRTGTDANTLFFNGRAGMTFFHNATTKTALAVGQQDDPAYDVLGLVYPRKNREDKLTLSRQAISVNSFSWVVSANCKNPELAIRFIDYLHMEPTRLLTAWGCGSEAYPTYVENEDGTRTFTDFMNANPDYDFTTCRSLYTLGVFQVMYDDMMERQQYNIPQNMQIWEAWATDNCMDSKVPSLITMTTDESREFTEIKSKMDNYADEMVYKFIFGDAPLDEFDGFVAQLKTLGADRACEIQQAAYDRFLAR